MDRSPNLMKASLEAATLNCWILLALYYVPEYYFNSYVLLKSKTLSCSVVHNSI
jgi:hypothetical protein